jgi:hypothetical protein
MSEINVITNPEDLPRRSSKNEVKENFRPEIKKGLKVDFCTEGRFSTPKELHFNGYSVEDITTLTTSTQDDLLENLLGIVEKLCVEGKEAFNAGDLTPEEFIEILINLKIRNSTSKHNHSWLCECQYSLPEDEQEFSYSEIDLKKVEFADISIADKELKEVYKKFFEEENNFKNYLKLKYPDKEESELKDITVESELNHIFIKEPVTINVEGNSYSFRFPRMKDLIQGTKKAQYKHKDEIKKIQKRKINPDKNIREQKEDKRKALDLIKKKIAKDSLIFSKALSMVAKNGHPITDTEKYEEWRGFSSVFANELGAYFNAPFGLTSEYDLWCNQCDKTIRRSLRHDPTLIWQLLPVSDSGSNGDDGKHTKPFIHISF